MGIDDKSALQITTHDHQVDFELGHKLSTFGYRFDHQFNDFGHQFGQEQLLQASLKSFEMCVVVAGRGARSYVGAGDLDCSEIVWLLNSLVNIM